MLTTQQIATLRDAAYQIADPINAYLLQDIARRISEAGQLTSTAQYQIWRTQQLGFSQKEIEKKLQQLLRVSQEEIRRILHQSAQSGYSLDVRRFPTVEAVPFGENEPLQQIVSAAVKLAQEDFSNLTKTLGMVDPFGNALPLQKAYRACTDFAFKQVITGAASYTEAVRQATRNLADKGVRTIDYQSGIHTSLEAAVRRNILGGLGLLQEQISQTVHDQLGCDGWEISAHANSAPDHEPIQGKQYPDAAYRALNDSLRRRIGTLNCGHTAFPIILGVNRPQHSPQELEQFRSDNEKGVTVDGVHYTGYQATQMQRSLERAIRAQKRKVMVDDAAGDQEKLAQDKTKLAVLHQRYREFSKAAGLRTQYERTEVAGFEGQPLDKQAKSGIIEPNRSKEIPEVSGTPTPIPQPKVQNRVVAVDVTEEYMQAATPEQGSITYEDGYKVKNHQAEIQMADWLHRTFGGDVKLLKESNVKNQETPDFLWHKKMWELKGTSSINGADKLLQHAIKQIQDNPGGVILNVLDHIDMSELEKQLARRFLRSNIDALDLMILSKDSLVKILRYKK